MHVAHDHFRDTTESTLVSLTEEELATWLVARGEKVVLHKGRYWLQNYPGFYSATHFLARRTPEEATRPCKACWGFRTALRDADRSEANGSMPLHMISDVANYTEQTLGSRNRNKLHKLRSQLRIAVLDRPDMLLEQGYDVLCSAHARNRYGRVPGRRAYQNMIKRYYDGGRCLVLGGLINEKLGGYLTGYAVGKTAYIDDLFLHSDYLRTNISLGLFFEWMQVCRRSETVHEVVHGMHAREAPGLCHYKEELGISIVHVPTRIWFAPLAGKIVKMLRPHAYYRLTGRG